MGSLFNGNLQKQYTRKRHFRIKAGDGNGYNMQTCITKQNTVNKITDMLPQHYTDALLEIYPEQYLMHQAILRSAAHTRMHAPKTLFS